MTGLRKGGGCLIPALLLGCSSLPPAHEEAQLTEPISDEAAARIYVDKGVAYLNARQYQVALDDLQKAVDLDGDNSEAHNALGVLYQQIDQSAQADDHFRKALSLKPDNYAARNNYGRFLCSVGRSQAAFEQFQWVLATRLYAQPWIPLTNAGVCAWSNGDKANAERYFREALEKQPRFPPALLELARISRETGRFSAARGFIQRYLQAAGATPESLTLAIEIEAALGNRSGASTYLQTLQRKFPDSTYIMRARESLGT